MENYHKVLLALYLLWGMGCITGVKFKPQAKEMLVERDGIMLTPKGFETAKALQ